MGFILFLKIILFVLSIKFIRVMAEKGCFWSQKSFLVLVFLHEKKPEKKS